MLDQILYDVAIIGGGVHGTSAARHLAEAGYSVVLLEKGDFGQGSTSRSTRVLHCGLRFLETGESFWKIIGRPLHFKRGLSSARMYMKMRSEYARLVPERVFSFKSHLPVYDDDAFSSWQVGLALRMLRAIGPKDVPLEVGRVAPSKARQQPLLRYLRDLDRLRSVHTFREYSFDWPERFAVDNALAAEELGADIRNYTVVEGLQRSKDGMWTISVRDLEQAQTRDIRARLVLNTAGIWIDRVNRMSNPNVSAKVLPTKGAHIVVQLPPDCFRLGMVNVMRDGMPAYLVPWRDTHHFGPTDTAYDGDVDDVRVTKRDRDFLLDEFNHLLPGAGVSSKSVVGVWAGLRPWTNEVQGHAKRVLHPTVHDLSGENMPGVFALTGASVSSHRKTGKMLRELVQSRIEPSGSARTLAQPVEEPPVVAGKNSEIAAIRQAAREHVVHLDDLLLRRLGIDYATTKGVPQARQVAETIADIMNWDNGRIDTEVEAFRARIARTYGVQGEETE